MRAGGRRRVGGAVLSLVVTVAIIGVADPSGAADPLPGAAVMVSPIGGNQVEPSIAVNPTNPRNLVAGYIDNGRCGVAWSMNAGADWNQAVLAESTDAPPPGLTAFVNAGDPVVDFAADGTAYYLCMNTAHTPTMNAQKTQYVYTSTNGGQDWNDASPTLAIAPAYADDDKGHIVVDTNPTSPNLGNVYVAATDLGSGQVRFARSTDGGASFSTPIPINDADIGFAVNVAVGADGAVYVAWEAEEPAGTPTCPIPPPPAPPATCAIGVRIDRSDNGGQKFDALPGGGDVEIQSTGITLRNVRPMPGRGNGFPYIGTHPTNPNLVYAVWAQPGPGIDDSDIHFSRSTDRGENWSPSVRVNMDVNPPGDFSSQFWPTMAVDPVDGDINIIWYSDENDPDRTDGTPRIDLYFTRSSNDGVSFDTPVRVTQTPSIPTPGAFFGDYLGIDAFGGVAHPLWVDTNLSTTFDAATTQIGPADLSIVKTDLADPVVAGGSVTYDVTITNTGPAEARDVVITDILPAGTSVAATSIPCTSVATGTIECPVDGPLQAGASATVQVTLDVEPSLVHDAGGAVTLTNTAAVSSTQPDPNPLDNSASETTTVLAETDLAVTSLTASGSVLDPIVGGSTTRALSAAISNGGPSSPVDAGVVFAATSGGGLSVALDPTPVAVADLAVGESRTAERTATITCLAPGAHTITFSASVSPDDPATTDPNPVNDSATSVTTIECVVPVAINIHPGSLTNPIQVASGGVVPVAILTTGAGEYGLPLAFDATSVEVDSVRFGTLDVLQLGAGATEIHGRGHPEDSLELDEVTRDGDIDLLLHFRTRDTAIAAGTTELCVRGVFDAGAQEYAFVGCDQIVLVP